MVEDRIYFDMKKRVFIPLIIAVAAVCFISYFVISLFSLPLYVPNINEDFQKALADCNKITIRDGGYDSDVHYSSNKYRKYKNKRQFEEDFGIIMELEGSVV